MGFLNNFRNVLDFDNIVTHISFARQRLSMHFQRTHKIGAGSSVNHVTARCCVAQVKVKIKVMLRLTVSRPVYLGVKHPSWAYDQIFITVRQLRVCWYGALSLTRERVCRLQLLLVLANAVILASESRGARDHILLSQIRDSRSLEGQVPVFISPRNRVAQLYPQTLGYVTK
jgi:hypothetical protein